MVCPLPTQKNVSAFYIITPTANKPALLILLLMNKKFQCLGGMAHNNSCFFCLILQKRASASVTALEAGKVEEEADAVDLLTNSNLVVCSEMMLLLITSSVMCLSFMEIVIIIV